MSRRLQLWGLAAFGISGIAYIKSGVDAGDVWVIWGSVMWLVGVGLFALGVRR